MNFEIDVPKKGNLGEDAPPINITSINRQWFVVAVFDGLGGSGSTIYEENGAIHTGAYIASRVAREVVYQFFSENIEKENFEIDEQLITEIKQQIKDKLQSKLALQKFEQSKLKSSLIRTFPTTMALGAVIQKDTNSLISVLWAGDSRVYIFSSREGLIQLTKDDLKFNNDPFENIEHDSPLSNMIHLDDDFQINHMKIDYEYPYFILAATDGCFGYYSTPMHFEYMLLEKLCGSNSLEEWKQKISEELKGISGDDFSMSIQYISKEEPQFLEIKKPYIERTKKMSSEYMEQIKTKESKISELEFLKRELKEINKLLWCQYRKTNYLYSKNQ